MTAPKLRFSGFDGIWKVSDMEGLSNKIGDGLHGTPEYVEGSDIYFINGNNIIDGAIFISSNTKNVSQHTYEKHNKKLTSNSVLISLNGTIGNIGLYKNEKVMLGKSVGYVDFINSPVFYYNYLQNERIQNFFRAELTGSTIKNLSLKTLRETQLFIPEDSAEQQKIADFFTTVDKKINRQKKKKELLEQYKKGVMQKIFSQELRFKDENGKDFPEWEEYKLKDILNEHGCKNVGSQVKEVFSVAKSKGVINQIEHLGRSFAATNVNHYKVLKPHDVVYTKSPTSNFPFGIIKQNKTGRTGIVSPLYGVFTPQTPQLGFILDYYFSVWQNTFNYLNPLVQKGAKNTMNIHNDTFLNGSELSLPTSPHEQQKIADFLIALDDKIAIVEQQINKTELWKKGLLQQMFV